MRDEEPDTDGGAPFIAGGAALFYGLMAAGAVALMLGFDIDPVLAIFGAPESEPLLGATAGAAVGLLIVGLSHLARHTRAMDGMRREFGSILGRQSQSAVFVIAMTSAVGEELLFRGALQPLLGVWPTVIIFGLLHGGGIKRLWTWTVFATLGGAIFAGLTLWTGSLLAGIVMHFTVNYFNLLAMGADEGDTRP
jgi:membrane protease YdiL (CAAX protease family)